MYFNFHQLLHIYQLSVELKWLHGFPCRSNVNVNVWYVKWWFILCHLQIATRTGWGMNWKLTTKNKVCYSIRSDGDSSSFSWEFQFAAAELAATTNSLLLLLLNAKSLHGASHSHWSLNGPRSLELMWFVVGSHAICRIRWFSTHTLTLTPQHYIICFDMCLCALWLTILAAVRARYRMSNKKHIVSAHFSLENSFLRNATAFECALRTHTNAQWRTQYNTINWSKRAVCARTILGFLLNIT